MEMHPPRHFAALWPSSFTVGLAKVCVCVCVCVFFFSGARLVAFQRPLGESPKKKQKKEVQPEDGEDDDTISPPHKKDKRVKKGRKSDSTWTPKGKKEKKRRRSARLQQKNARLAAPPTIWANCHSEQHDVSRCLCCLIVSLSRFSFSTFYGLPSVYSCLLPLFFLLIFVCCFGSLSLSLSLFSFFSLVSPVRW